MTKLFTFKNGFKFGLGFALARVLVDAINGSNELVKSFDKTVSKVKAKYPQIYDPEHPNYPSLKKDV